MKDLFLPPGVQIYLHEALGNVPRSVEDDLAVQVEYLWTRRNQASESDVERIDQRMQTLVIRHAFDRLLQESAQLRGVVDNLLTQSEQMRGLFTDEDGAIATAVDEAQAVLASTQSH